MKTKKSMYRTLALMTAALTAVSLTGCGRGAGSGSTLEVSFEHSYASQMVETPGTQVQTIIPLGENVLLMGYDADWKTTVTLYDAESGTTTPAKLHYQQKATEDRMIDVMGILENENGTISVLYNDYTVDEDWNYLSQCYYMETYDSAMNLMEEKDITDNWEKDAYYYNFQKDGMGNIFAVTSDDEGYQSIAVLDDSFAPVGKVDMNVSYVENMVCSEDGSIYVTAYSDTSGQIFGKINPDTMKLENVTIEDMPEWFNGMLAGSSGYDFYLYDSSSIYGVKTADGTCEEVLNWVNSDFTGDYVSSVAALPDGRFLTSQYDSDYENATLWLMEERSAEDMENMEVISLATLYGSQNLVNAVCAYNRSSDRCRIVIKDYEQEYNSGEDWEAGMNQFRTDMTSGKVADMICTDGLAFETFANKGLFVDLYTLMEQDPDFRQEDYFTNYFQSLEYKDTLQRISFSFNIDTLAGKTEYVGEQTGLNPTEFMELMKNTPDGMDPFPHMTKSTALYALCLGNLSSFVDAKNATSSFDSPEFAELLELCNSYPADDTLNYEDDSYWVEQEMAYRSDTALLKTVNMWSPSDYHTLLMGDFGTNEVTLLGYPTVTDGSNGGRFQPDFTIAISSQSKYQEEIWEFLKYMLSEEYQSSLNWTLPVHKGTFQSLMEEAVNSQEEYGNYYYLGEEELDIGYPTQEEMNAFLTYAESITECTFYDESVYEIVYEEAEMFFAGDQSAQETADMIQSRVGIYLSEQS